jgi:enoyl-CoA hydratase/carnithine racemase
VRAILGGPAIAAGQTPEETMVTEHVRLERKDGLAVLTLTNPGGNRIGHGVLVGLRNALVEIRKPACAPC